MWPVLFIAKKLLCRVGCLLAVRYSSYLQLPVICAILVPSALPLVLGRTGKHYTAATVHLFRKMSRSGTDLMLKVCLPERFNVCYTSIGSPCFERNTLWRHVRLHVFISFLFFIDSPFSCDLNCQSFHTLPFHPFINFLEKKIVSFSHVLELAEFVFVSILIFININLYNCSCDCIHSLKCVLYCLYSFMCFFCLIMVLFCVMFVICLLCLIVLPLPPGKTPFSVKINKNYNVLPHTCIAEMF
jgi:hypothetical protein